MTEEPAPVFALCRFLDHQGLFRGSLNRLQRRMLAFYLREQQRQGNDREEQDFKSLYFALAQRDNEKVYEALFKNAEEASLEEIEASDDYGWEVPKSEADLQRIYREARRMGLMS